MAALRIRNALDRITYSDKSKSEGEQPPFKQKKMSDYLPDAVKDVPA